MEQAWVVVVEEGAYSDYRMELISVHDCKESADAACAALNEEVDKKQETAREILRKAWELSGREAPSDRTIWAVQVGCPAKFMKEVIELYHAAVKEYTGDIPEYSVHGPFDVVPWVKPEKQIRD